MSEIEREDLTVSVEPREPTVADLHEEATVLKPSTNSGTCHCHLYRDCQYVERSARAEYFEKAAKILWGSEKLCTKCFERRTAILSCPDFDCDWYGSPDELEEHTHYAACPECGTGVIP